MWSSYELLNPWRAWGGGHRSTSDWAKVKILVLPVGQVSLIHTITPQDFAWAHSPPQPQSYPHTLVCLWCSSHTSIEPNQPIKPRNQKPSHFFCSYVGWHDPKQYKEWRVSSRSLEPGMGRQWGGDGRRMFPPFSTDELFTSPHSLAPHISKENNIPKILVNSKDFIECFEMYLHRKVVEKWKVNTLPNFYML